MTTVPFVGDKGRKFNIFVEGHLKFEIEGQFNPHTKDGAALRNRTSSQPPKKH